MNKSDWELLILRYLKDQGYKEAEQALERNIRSHDSEAMSLSDRLSVHKGVVEALVTTFATSGQPQAYVEALDRLSAWLDNSLDMYRGELSKLLHPIFMHCYLALIAKDATPTAQALLGRYRRRLVSLEGSLSKVRAAELAELQGVAVKQHLESNAFAKQVMSSKHTIRLSAYAHGLLMHFLHCNPGMLCIASLVNQHINLEIAATTEPEEDDVDAQPGFDGATERADVEALNINLANVNLGLLKGHVEDKYAETTEQKAQEEKPVAADGGGDGGKAATEGGDAAAGAGEGGSAPAAKKVKKDGKGAPAADTGPGAQGTVVRLHPGERVEPQPWTPQATETVMTSWLSDVEFRADVGTSFGPGAGSMPSCCFFTFANTRQTMNCAAFTLGANLLAAGFSDSSVRLYDLAATGAKKTTGKAGTSKSSTPPPTSSLDDDDNPTGVSYLYGHTGPVHSVSFTHDSRLMLSGSGDGTVRAWSTDLGTGLTAYRGHLLPIWDVAIGPLGYQFVTGSADRTARVWSTDSVRMLRILAGHQSDVDVVGWHPNTMYVATASSDRSVRLWDVATGTCVRFMTGLTSPPTCMAMHPDGKHIAVGSDRGSVLAWDLGSARRIASFKAHAGPVWSMTYSRGLGSILATGGADETVRLWTTQTTPTPADTPIPAGTGAGAASKATGDAGSSARAPPRKPYSQLTASHTKSSSITHLHFSHRNLLLAAGAFNLRTKKTR